MAAPAAVLSILIRANTGKATTGLIRLNQNLEATEKNSHKVARAMEKVAAGVALIGGASVVGGLIYATKKAADFEQQMSALGAVSDASAKQMQQFRKQALKAGADTKFSALEAAKAQTELAKGGLSVARIAKGGLRSALALAAAGELDLADAAEATVNAMKLFGLRGKDAMKVADAFATAANKTTADVSDFALSLKMGGSAAKAAGLSFIETTAALEALAETGIRGSDAGTSLKAMLAQLAAPTAKQKELSKKLNIEFFDQAGHMKSLTDVAGMLRNRLVDLTDKERLHAVKVLAGTDGMRAMLSLYDAGPGKMARFQRELSKEGTAAEVARKKQDNLKGSLEQLRGSIETLGIQVGTALIPIIRKGADGLKDLANGIGEIIDRKDLTLGEKLQQSIDLAKVKLDPWVDKFEEAIDHANIPEKIAAAISAATPVIIKAAAGAGLVAAKTFAGAFADSDVWGKLVLGGWLLSRMGGKAGFFKMGATAGSSFGAGMAVTGGGGLLGKLKGSLGALKGVAAKLIALDVGINLVDSKGNLIAAAINTAHDLTFGIVPKVKVQSGDERAEASIAAVADQLDRALKGGNIGALEQVRNKIAGMAEEARDFGRADLAGQLEKLARRGSDSLNTLSAAQHKVTGMSGRFADAIRGLKLKGSNDFDDLVHQVTFGSRQILRVGGGKSKETQEAISHQFDLARRRVKEAMDKKVISVKKGTELLHTLAVKELALYGISAGRVNVVLARGAKGQMRPHARGGPITEGKAHGDSVPALLERGEYVVNRKAVQKVGRGALDRLNFAAAPRFQSGGIAGMVGAANKLDQARFPYVWGGGHQGSPAPFGPMDCSGAVSFVLQHGGVKIPTMVASALAGAGKPGPGPVTVFANATHTFMKLGSRFFGTSGSNPGGGAGWFPDPGADYRSRFTQRHFDVGEALGIARVMLQGPASVALEAGQGALDRIRGAAQSSIDAYTSTAIGSGDIGDSGFSGKWTEVMAQIAKSRGWNLGDWRRLVQGESGGNPNARNKSSGAYGLGQFLGRTAEAYAKYGALSANPVDQIRAMAQYISDRYGNPSKALSFWLSHDPHWYSQGGMVGMAAGGLAGAVRKTLKKVRGGKTPKIRQAAIHKLLERVKKSGKVGLPEKLQGDLKKYSTDANTFADYADRASQLSVEDADGNLIPVSVKGKTEIQWLGDQLTALWQWRNAILKAEKIIRDRREKIAEAIEVARKRFYAVSRAIKEAAKTRKTLDSQLTKAQKKPKQNKALIKILRGKMKDIDQAQEPRKRIQNALKERILPALTGKASDLGTLRGELMTNLDEVQGPGSSMKVMKKMPTALGQFGGTIFGVQMRLRDLNAPRIAPTDSNPDTGADTSERASLLEQLLREANLRTAVSEAQFKVFKEMPQFATGGIVPGPVGAATAAVVHAGEGVFTRDQMAAMGTSNVVVIVQDGAVDKNKIRVIAGQEAERITRAQSRNANRGLPGRGGGVLRG